MSYNAKAFLADRERLLEPDSVIIRGSQKWHKQIIIQHAKINDRIEDTRSEKEIEEMEDNYLRSHGII